MSEVVWWTQSGHVLHKDPDCPPLMRARARQIATLRRGTWAGDTVFSYDFAEDSMVDSEYPPFRLMPCKLCAKLDVAI